MIVGSQQQSEQAAEQPQQPKFMAINVGGRDIYVQEGATPQAIQKAIEHYRTTPEFAESIDRAYRVPWHVRSRVGSIESPQDRLNELKKYYPDAVPYDDDNFVFTKEDGRIGLYNPKGLDSGDLASLSREITIGIGSTLGAVFGAGGGLVVGAPTGPGVLGTTIGGASVGAGFGGSVSAGLYDFLLQNIAGVENTQSVAQRTLGLLQEGAMAAGGEVVGAVGGAAVKQSIKEMLGGGTLKAQAIYARLARQEITPTAGVVTEGRAIGRVEAALGQATASATRMRNEVERVLIDTARAVRRVSERIGRARTQQGAGEAIQEGVEAATRRFRAQQAQMETRLSTMIGDDATIGLNNIKALRDELKQAAEQAPRSLGAMYNDAIATLNNILSDARPRVSTVDTGLVDAAGNPITRTLFTGNDGISYSAFRQLRTVFGERMSDMTEGSVKRSMAKRVYGALSQDLNETIAKMGDDVAAQFDDTIRLTREWNETNAKLFRRLTEYDAPEKAYRYMINSSKDGGTMLQRLRTQFTDDEWKDISATVIQKMGFKNFGNEADDAFSFSRFVSNFQDISDEAKDAIFGAKSTELRQSLEELVVVFRAMNDNVRLRNHANTAGTAFQLEMFRALGMDITGMATDLAMGVAPVQASKNLMGTMLGMVVMPNQVAKLLTNPDFVKWLATPIETRAKIPAHIGRLSAIAAANPAISDAMQAFTQSLTVQETEQ